MAFIITLICNLVALSLGAFAFLAFNASGGIFGKPGRTATGIIIALVIAIISGAVSHYVLGAAGIGATFLAAAMITFFIVFKPLSWFKRK